MGTAVKAKNMEVAVTELISERVAYASAMKKKANQIRVIALQAAQASMLEARREPGQDPAIVDEQLRTLDRLLIAANAEQV